MIISVSDTFWSLCVEQCVFWGTTFLHLLQDVVFHKPFLIATFLLSFNPWSRIFPVIFIFRYVRLLVHIVAFWKYKPYPVPKVPSYTSKDVTVIVPTIKPYGEEFDECIRSVVHNHPADILVVTAGAENLERGLSINTQYPEIQVSMVEWPNKRVQICKVLPQVQTKITVLCDDHVFWPPEFLSHVLAPFEDLTVGTVCMCKRVRRISQGFSSADFWNFIGTLYLERHNFDCAATTTVDGGVFCVSGRTSAHRTKILAAPDFMQGFLHEYCFLGLVGPLHTDDDNFITRWMVNHEWKIAFQHTPGACMETTLGEYPKFLKQCLRWVRTTWRSNFTSLFIDRKVWLTQPWCVYAVYLTSFFNFALFYDFTLLSTGWLAFNRSPDMLVEPRTAMVALGLWMFCSKLVKPLPHFWRNPKDIVYFPGYLMFGYFHSLIKLYALFTFYDKAWGSRPGVDRPRNIEYPIGGISGSSIRLPALTKGFKSMARIGALVLFVYCLHVALQTIQGGIWHTDGVCRWEAAFDPTGETIDQVS